MRYIVCVQLFFVITLGAQIGANSQFLITPPDKSPLVKSYTTDDGLPQNTPTAMVQTRDGYIWIATFGGLARFDGLKFTVFTTSEFPELVNNRVTALAEDKNGVLWIGSEDGDLVSYRNGKFSANYRSRGEIGDSVVRAIYVDENNSLWIGNDSGLSIYHLPDGILERIPPATLTGNAAERVFGIRSFAKDGSGALWMASGRGIVRLSDGRYTYFRPLGSQYENEFWRLATNPYGPVFVFLRDSLATFDGQNLQPVNVTRKGAFPPNSPLSADFVFWDGIYRPTETGLEMYPIELGVAKSEFPSTLLDRERNLWVGYPDRLSRFTRRMIAPFALSQDGVNSPATCVMETPDGSVYVCSKSKLVRFKDGTSSVVLEVPDKDILSVAFDPIRDTLWVGADDRIFSGHEGIFTKFENPGLGDSKHFKLFVDRSGTLWIGTSQYGVKRYRNGVMHAFSKSEGLADNAVTRIFEDSERVIWIGTRHGMSRIVNDQVVTIADENELTNDYVRDFYEDPDGTIWIGTYGGGLVRFRDGLMTTINEASGLAENIVSRILPDDNNNLWILGNRGVYSVSRNSLNEVAEGRMKRLYCSVYGKPDGMDVTEGNAINQPGGWRTQDGKMWFPMIQGGIVVDPSKERSTPNVLIESAKLNGNLLTIGTELYIPDGDESLEINYTAVTFYRSEQVQFRYMLEGFDKAWQEAGTRRVAYYPNLPPGDYSFKVAGLNEFGETVEPSATLRVVVEGPFRRTNAFYLMLIVASLGLIVLAYKLRMKKVVRDQENEQAFARQLIEAHESERKRVAGEIHDGIGHWLLTIKNGLTQTINKFDRNTVSRRNLESVVAMTTSALEETRTISSNLRPVHLRRFGLTGSLQNLVQTIQQASLTKIVVNLDNVDNIFSAEDELSIYRIVQESLNNIIKHSYAKSATVSVARSEKGIDIIIEDDGVGFDTRLHDSMASGGSTNIGLNNIRQRAKLMGGKYAVKSLISRGTMVTLTIPSKKVLGNGRN